jgi:hypothetical protein
VPPGSTLVLDLTAIHPSYATRVLLRAPAADRLVFALQDRHLGRTGLSAPESPVRRLLGVRYQLELTRHQVPSGVAVLVARRRPAEDLPAEHALARYVLDHPRARLLSAWREAVIATSRQRGVQVSKNEARALIRQAIDVAPLRERYLCELPQPELEAVASALCDAAGGSPGEPASASSAGPMTRSPAAYQPETS